jgi:prophage tail gpP-like protein
MIKPKTREVTEELLRDTKVALKWIAKDIDLDKVRFRDGAIIADELNRVSSENGYYMFETRFGELCVTDDTLRVSGEALVLGRNILTFSATQDEAVGKEQIKVKGQRSKKNIRGEAALIKTFKTVLDGNTVSKIPLIVQHYGDATDEALERRGKFEIDKRNAASKEVTIEVFGVSQSDGKPWDVGMLHYVEIPPEDIFDQFECTGVSVTIASDKTYKTTLTLSPPPSGASGSSLLSSGAVDYSSFGESRRATLSVGRDSGLYPSSWKSADVSFISVIEPVVNLVTQLIKLDDELPSETLPPEKQ